MRVKPLVQAPRNDGEMVYWEKAKDEGSGDGKWNETEPNGTELKVSPLLPTPTRPTRATTRAGWPTAYEWAECQTRALRN